jgi:hypothetical protein
MAYLLIEHDELARSILAVQHCALSNRERVGELIQAEGGEHCTPDLPASHSLATLRHHPRKNMQRHRRRCRRSIIDSPRVKSQYADRTCSIDSGKHVNGRKRQIVGATLGCLPHI